MKKWLILTLISLFLILYGGFLFSIEPARTPEPEVTATTSETEGVAIATTLPETLPPTVPETTEAETIPPSETIRDAFSDASIAARNAFVYDFEDDTLLYSKGDMQHRITPASLTKLFTCQVVLSHMDPKTIVTAGEETTWIDPASSVAFVTPGDTLSVATLIQGMMMQSGNDAAYCAAVTTGRVIANDPRLSAQDALAVFMDEMNRQAEELGLTGTHFATPDGLDAYGHYTTTQDLLTIAKLAVENPLIRHYAGLQTSHVMYDNQETHTYRSTNFHIDPASKYYIPEACGLKTGSTQQSGSCVFTLIYHEERYLLIGVLGSATFTSRFDDTMKLYNHFCG